MSDDKTKVTSLRLTPEIHKRLRYATFDKGISMQKAVEDAIMAWLEQHKPEDKRAA